MRGIKEKLRQMYKSAVEIEKMEGHSNGLDRCVLCDLIEKTKGGICLNCREKRK